MSNTALSVIIPTRNEDKLLRSCLGQFTPAIKKQFGIEIIISDGGSIDATLSIAREYTDLVARHENPSRRQTIAEGRNKGAAIASGEIFIFLNADTQIPYIENFFSRIIAKMSSGSIAALAVKVEVLPEERKLSDKIFHSYFNSYIRLINFLGLGIGRGECQIVRHSAFHAVYGYNELLAAGEDFDLYKRLRHVGKVVYDPKLLVYESPRRYRKYGYVKVYSEWIKNGFSVLFKKKASSDIWEEVR